MGGIFLLWYDNAHHGYLTSLARRRKISPIQVKTDIPSRDMNSRQVYDA
jgi:hypothetical protein